jgi:GH24 family phage-related lysozyme (muramidase)
VGDFDTLVAFARKYGQSITQGSGIAPGFQATRASVVNSFVPWSTPLEGNEHFPYTDAEGLVTTALGDLIDGLAAGQKMHENCGHLTTTPCGQATPTAAARALPWSPNNIDADWAAIKAAWPGTQSTACAAITTSRLSADADQALVASRMTANEADLLKGLPGYAQAPADAQLAAMSMAWAMGSGFPAKFPAFTKAFNAGDYLTAAAQSHMQGVGIDMRNLANKLLLTNASMPNIDPDHLYYLEGLALSLPGTAMLGPALATGSKLLTTWGGMPTWQKALLGVGAAVVVAGAVYGVISVVSSD